MEKRFPEIDRLKGIIETECFMVPGHARENGAWCPDKSNPPAPTNLAAVIQFENAQAPTDVCPPATPHAQDVTESEEASDRTIVSLLPSLVRIACELEIVGVICLMTLVTQNGGNLSTRAREVYSSSMSLYPKTAAL